jgi:hypothetical protein
VCFEEPLGLHEHAAGITERVIDPPLDAAHKGGLFRPGDDAGLAYSVGRKTAISHDTEKARRQESKRGAFGAFARNEAQIGTRPGCGAGQLTGASV